MLTCKVGDNIVNTFENLEEDIRKWSRKGILKCPACNGNMIYRHGKIKIAHFAHEANECTEKYSEGETEEHAKGKKLLYEWLKTQKDIQNLKLEAWIPETKQRPDLYFEVNKRKYVFEFQCSPISSEYLERRELYRMAGIKDIWILGTEKYNIKADKRGQVIHSGRYKEIEKYKHCYLDLNNKNIISASEIISKYLKYNKISLDSFYENNLDILYFDPIKNMIALKDEAIEPFRKSDKNKYDELLQEISRKVEFNSKIKTMIGNLTIQYRRLNDKYSFEYGKNRGSGYKWKVVFKNKYDDLYFFIKDSSIDCCMGHNTKQKSLWGNYPVISYTKLCSVKDENVGVCSNLEFIKNFVRESVSNYLRNKKYGGMK